MQNNATQRRRHDNNCRHSLSRGQQKKTTNSHTNSLALPYPFKHSVILPSTHSSNHPSIDSLGITINVIIIIMIILTLFTGNDQNSEWNGGVYLWRGVGGSMRQRLVQCQSLLWRTTIQKLQKQSTQFGRMLEYVARLTELRHVAGGVASQSGQTILAELIWILCRHKLQLWIGPDTFGTHTSPVWKMFREFKKLIFPSFRTRATDRQTDRRTTFIVDSQW